MNSWMNNKTVLIEKTTSGPPVSVKMYSYFSSNLGNPLMSDAGVALHGLLFPIAASLFEAQQLNKRQNCS